MFPDGLMAFPEIIWEGGLGIYLILKGFKTPAPPAAAARRRGRFSRGDRPAPALTAS